MLTNEQKTISALFFSYSEPEEEREMSRLSQQDKHWDYMSECVSRWFGEEIVNVYAELTSENAKEKLIELGWTLPKSLTFDNFQIGRWLVSATRQGRSVQTVTATMNFVEKKVDLVYGCSS